MIVDIRVRPRWKRVLYWPKLVWRHWFVNGIPLRECVRMANIAVAHPGPWLYRDEGTDA